MAAAAHCGAPSSSRPPGSSSTPGSPWARNSSGSSTSRSTCSHQRSTTERMCRQPLRLSPPACWQPLRRIATTRRGRVVADVELATPTLIAGSEHRQRRLFQGGQPRGQRSVSSRPVSPSSRPISVFASPSSETSSIGVLVPVDEHEANRSETVAKTADRAGSDEQSPPKTTGNRSASTAVLPVRSTRRSSPATPAR